MSSLIEKRNFMEDALDKKLEGGVSISAPFGILIYTGVVAWLCYFNFGISLFDSISLR
jgi:hypothetical protein